MNYIYIVAFYNFKIHLKIDWNHRKLAVHLKYQMEQFNETNDDNDQNYRYKAKDKLKGLGKRIRAKHFLNCILLYVLVLIRLLFGLKLQ